MRERKSVKFNIQQQEENNSDQISPFKLSKLLDPEASWDKDQLGDVLHWIRQIVAIIFGLLWGAIPVVGAIWIVVFLALSSAIVYAYYAMILKVDEEDFGGHGALLQEGLFASITLFLLLGSSDLINIVSASHPSTGCSVFVSAFGCVWKILITLVSQ